VKDEKNIKCILSYPFINGVGYRLGQGKDCAVKRARLFRLRLQGQDKFYPANS
jgi:hypothetical protein